MLLHILKETLAGVFDVPYDRFETFEEGLLRYRLLVLCQTEAERDKALAQLETPEKYRISRQEDVDPFRKEIYVEEYGRYGYFSEFDKYEISEVHLADPIRDKTRLIDSEDGDEDSPEDDPVFAEFTRGANGEVDGESVAPLNGPKRRAKSLDDLAVFSEDSVTCMRWLRSFWRLVSKLLWDNIFFERLFPLIKQQKPGQDLYVLVATVQSITVVYLFFFYPLMVGSQQSIGEQFSSNAFSEPLVVSLIVCMVIMVTDRILYSQHAFLAGTKNLKYGQEQEEA